MFSGKQTHAIVFSEAIFLENLPKENLPLKNSNKRKNHLVSRKASLKIQANFNVFKNIFVSECINISKENSHTNLELFKNY